MAQSMKMGDKVIGTVRGRGKQKKPTKIPTTLRLSPDVMAYFKATGEGWQTRVDAALREYIQAHPYTLTKTHPKPNHAEC
jgi:uncharacterized protein (DUF4415 family)